MTTADDLVSKIAAEVTVTYLDRIGARVRNGLRPRAWKVTIDEYGLVALKRAARRPAYETVFTISDLENITVYPTVDHPAAHSDVRHNESVRPSGDRIPLGYLVTVGWIDHRRRYATFRVPESPASFSVYPKNAEPRR